MTVDCGEGKHELCIGWGTETYLFPQLDGDRFECRCWCHGATDDHVVRRGGDDE